MRGVARLISSNNRQSAKTGTGSKCRPSAPGTAAPMRSAELVCPECGRIFRPEGSESSSQKGFSRAGSIFDQQVTTGNRANQRPLDEDITAEVD